jgi:hypothetical protein
MERIDNIANAWNNLLVRKRKTLNIADVEFSALSSWVMDCLESYKRVYFDLLSKIEKADPNDYDLLHDCVSEIYFDLSHIREHIEAAEKGFIELMRVLAEKGGSSGNE